MPSLRQVFSAPFNWCDRRCERCPLASGCPVQRREQQLRWVHEARGEDPDDPAVMLEDASEMLESALRMVLEIAQAEGIDLDAPLPPRPTVLAAKRLERSAMALVRCVAQVVDRGDAQAGDSTRGLLALTSTLAAKVGRIAGQLDLGADDETWARDAAPNLLLIDRLRAELARKLALLPQDGARDAGLQRALRELDRDLEPLIRDVGAETRDLLAALEARGAAPSPFIT